MTTINTPTGGDGEKKTNIQELTEEKKSEISEILFGDKEAILKDLKEHHVKIEENAEMMGYKGKKVHINLPAVGNFEGFKFDYFISNETLSWGTFQENLEIQEKSHSLSSSQQLLKKLNEYMKEMGVIIDGEIDYAKDLNHWEGWKYTCEAGNCLKDITGLKDLCLLKDRDITNPGQHTYWFLGYGDSTCEFYTAPDDDDPSYKRVYNLFLRLD